MYQYPDNIFAAVRQEKNDFLTNYIEIVDGLLFNQYQTIKKIHKYYNSHYETGDYEIVNGVRRKKVFYNINKWRADVATKMIDIDIKDWLLLPENQATAVNVFLLEKELKAWLKRNKMGQILNEIGRKLPIYGSVVLKKVKGGAEMIDLRYFFTDQGSANLTDSRYIIQKHLMTPGELRRMRGIWENVDEVIDKFCNFIPAGYELADNYNAPVSSPYAEIYEAYGERPKSWFTGKEKDKNDYVLAKFIIAGVDHYKTDDKGNVTEEGLVLYKQQIKELPFKEVHFQKTEGRWLGIGVVEDTFEAQRQVNRVKDSEAKAMELAALMIFQSRDELAARNLLSDVENGDIMKVRSELTRVDNKINNLGEFENITQSYEVLADRLTFSYDVVRGEAPPASATLGAVQQQIAQASSAFDYKRENIGLFLNEFITDLVFPELAKKINTPHVFRFAGDKQDMEKMRTMIVEAYLRTKILETGVVPNDQEYQMAKDKYMNVYRTAGDKIWLQINKDFFNNLEYEVSLEITGEGRDIQAQLTNVSTILTELSRNPQLLDNPLLKRLLFKQMTLMGMSLSELEGAEQELASLDPQKQAMLQGASNARNLGGAAQPVQPQGQPAQ